MNIWKIEYIGGHSVSRFKIIKADTIRMSKVNGDLWFCNNDEMDAENNHLPKMIVANGSYLSVERVEPKAEPIVVDLSEKMKKAMGTQAEVENIRAERMEVNIVEPNEKTKKDFKENKNDWI